MPDLLEQLIRHEGVRLKPYRCTAGKLTIGVGRNIEERGITHEEALMLLDHDIAICRDEAVKAWVWFPLLDKVRQNVLLNMIFNMGMPRVLKFKNMIYGIEMQDYTKAASDMLDSVWAGQVGSRASELAQQMKDGK